MLIAILLDGLAYAAWLFLVAVGLTLIYGVMRILNIAHGAFYTIGAYACATALGAWYAAELPEAASFLVMGVVAVAVGVLVGLAVERGVLRHLYGRDEVLMVLVTYALFLILEDSVKLVWGVESYFVFQPYAYFGYVELGPLPYQVYDLLMVGFAGLPGLGLWLRQIRTRMGRLTIVVVADCEIAAGMGVNVARVFSTTFAIGTVLAVIGGVVTAPKIAVTPGIGVEVIVLAFAVVVIGGLGSIPGAAIGALFTGFARAASVHLAPELELFAIYAVMALVLAVRPHGLFAQPTARRI